VILEYGILSGHLVCFLLPSTFLRCDYLYLKVSTTGTFHSASTSPFSRWIADENATRHVQFYFELARLKNSKGLSPSFGRQSAANVQPKEARERIRWVSAPSVQKLRTSSPPHKTDQSCSSVTSPAGVHSKQRKVRASGLRRGQRTPRTK